MNDIDRPNLLASATLSADRSTYSVQAGWVATRQSSTAAGSDISYHQAVGLANQPLACVTTVIYPKEEDGKIAKTGQVT